MSDNTELSAGSGGDTIATDDISGVKYPRTKITVGADGVNDGDVSSSNPLPVDGTGTAGTAAGGVLTIQGVASMTPVQIADNSGSITVDNAGTFAVQAACTNAGTFAVQVDGAALTALQLIDNLVLAEDAAHQSGDVGVQALSVRQDTPAALGQTDGDYQPLITDSSGRLHVNVGNTVTVGSHAVTNAGTFVVQENGAALTALQLIDDAVYVDDADWTDSTSKHMLVGGLYQSSPQTITDGDVGPIQVDSNGAVKVAIVSGAGSGGTASDDDADFTAGTTSGTPAMGVYESSPSSVTDGDMGIVGITQTRAMRCSVEGTVTVGSHAVTNAGTFAVQVDGAALTALQIIDDWDESDRAKVNLIVGQAGVSGNSGTVDATTQRVVLATDVALPAGTNAIGKLAANSGVDIGDVDVLSIATGTNTIGNVGLVPRTSGGLSIFRSIDLDETEEEVKGSAGQVYGIHAFNLHTAELYLKLYNATAANVTVGTTTPVLTYVIPAQSDGNGAGFIVNVPQGIAFDTAITAACTTGVLDNDTGAPGNNVCVVNILYA